MKDMISKITKRHLIGLLFIICHLSFSMMLASCTEDDDNGPAHPGLGIKTFFPTKVVTNQPMTINGSGFTDVTEIEFPGGAKVTNFEIVSDDMIRVDAPSGIATEGGKIILRSANGQVESRLPLTVGHTQVTGFSKQPGETAAGGELITVFGTDLEFINAVELLDADSVPQLIDHQDFYRKGTNNLIFRVPLKNIYKGTFVGILHTYDGQSISMPELTYEPAADEGHWETVKTIIWKNDGAGAVSWNGIYRFALEGHDGANECIAEIPQDIWDRMMTETFYLDIQATDPQVRITNGWWDSNWKDDIQPGNELLTDNGDGTWTVAINVADNPDYVATLLEKHILFTGDRYTPIQIYFEDQEWVDGGGGHSEIVKTSIWKGDGSAGAVSWSSQYRFSSEENVTGEEIYAIPMDIWKKMKTETFYLDLEATDPQIRVTTGWWSTTWTGEDIFPGNEHLTDNGDGTFTLEINLSGDAALLELLDVQHLLFTGDRYTPLEIYFKEEIWVDGGGGSNANEVVIWQGDGSAGAVSWNGTYRFANVEHITGEEIYAIPMDQWEVIRTSTFYLDLEATDPQIRVTTGWWSTTWTGADFQPGTSDLLKDNGDGTWTLEINLSGDPILDALDVEHLLFTGDRFTPTKLYYYE
jgi:hypothetical protein